MRRGTTPTHEFKVNINLTTAEEIYITYEQGGKVKVEKEISDITVEAEKLTVKLTQAETLALKENTTVRVQIRARFADGTAVASNIIARTAGEILKEGEI